MRNIRQLSVSTEASLSDSIIRLPGRSLSANNSPFAFRAAKGGLRLDCDCSARFGVDLDRLKEDVEAIKGFLGFRPDTGDQGQP